MHVGRWVVVPVAAFDLLAKGALPVYLAQRLDAGPWLPVMVGIAAVAGHNWSIYLKFTGGRGIVVVIGTLMVLALNALLAAGLVVIVGWVVFRSSALWVGIGSATLPAWSVAFGASQQVTVLCVCLVALLAAKRLTSNLDMPCPKDGGWKVYVHRLLYDRDGADRDEWVHQTPGERSDNG